MLVKRQPEEWMSYDGLEQSYTEFFHRLIIESAAHSQYLRFLCRIFLFWPPAPVRRIRFRILFRLRLRWRIRHAPDYFVAAACDFFIRESIVVLLFTFHCGRITCLTSGIKTENGNFPLFQNMQIASPEPHHCGRSLSIMSIARSGLLQMCSQCKARA